MSPEERDEVLREYYAACHAMQAGVAFEMEHGSKDTQPKHLRVGVNTAHCDHGALVGLLIKKGIITNEEYEIALRDAMLREVASYEERIQKNHGINIKLGGLSP